MTVILVPTPKPLGKFVFSVRNFPVVMVENTDMVHGTVPGNVPLYHFPIPHHYQEETCERKIRVS